jgi:hypothetical protein
VTAQLTADPNLVESADFAPYARRSIPYAVGIGFIAGLTADALLGKSLGMDVIRTSGVESARRSGRNYRRSNGFSPCPARTQMPVAKAAGQLSNEDNFPVDPTERVEPPE